MQLNNWHISLLFAASTLTLTSSLQTIYAHLAHIHSTRPPQSFWFYDHWLFSFFSKAWIWIKFVEMYNNGLQRSTKPKEEEIWEFLNPSDTTHILFPLFQEILKLVKDISKTAEPLSNGLSQHLFEVMQASEILWKAPFPLHKMAFNCRVWISWKVLGMTLASWGVSGCKISSCWTPCKPDGEWLVDLVWGILLNKLQLSCWESCSVVKD